LFVFKNHGVVKTVASSRSCALPAKMLCQLRVLGNNYREKSNKEINAHTHKKQQQQQQAFTNITSASS
jgi:hypothetical protein